MQLSSKTTFVHSALSLLLSCGMVGTAQAADETLQKQGAISALPTADASTSHIDWTVTHSNNTLDLMENVILTDRLEGNQEMVPGTLIMPQGWSVQYSIDGGGTFTTIEPDSGANAMVFSNPFVVPSSLGQGRTMTLPVSTAVNLSGGGDGFNPVLLDNGRIMGINHHSGNPGIWCYDSASERKCPGYPIRPNIPTGNAPISTAIGNRMYIGDDSSYTSYGQRGKVYCWDSDQNRSCGATPVVPGAGYAGPVVVDGDLYVLTKLGTVDCYDPEAGLRRCKDFTPVDLGVFPGSTRNVYDGSDFMTLNKRIYFSTSEDKVACFDVTTRAKCADWAANPMDIPNSDYSYNLFWRTDAIGNKTGFCTGGGYPV